MEARFTEVEPPLSDAVLAVVAEMGFESMTPVQAAVIPHFLGNKDVAVEACTGSGKTLAFVIPVMERVLGMDPPLSSSQVGAVIISPTRELARQIFGVVTKFTAHTPDIHPILLVGGTDVTTDLERCRKRGCNIVVATPGRLLDVLNRTASTPDDISFKTVEALVLDEADTLLDMGFADAVTEILTKLPKQRRTGLFSATQTREVAALTRAGLRNPAIISVKVQYEETPGPEASDGSGDKASRTASGAGAKVQSTPTTLTNYYTLCENAEDKIAEMLMFLRERAALKQKAIVFVLTCASVDYYGRLFASEAVRKAAGLPSADAFPILPLHGQMAPKKRVANFKAYASAAASVLLCTDVAARGIDIPDVDWILQVDPPKDPAFFVHRVGRTARAGRKGCAKLLLLQKESGYIPLLNVKHVPISEARRGFGTDDAFGPEELRAFLMTMRQEAVADRDILERGTKAFISFMRGYSEHVCRYIFKLKNLEIPSLASAFGLVKLPKVDELRGQEIPYEGLPGVDTSTIAFKDPAREAQRQARLVAEAEKQAAARAARDARRERAIHQVDAPAKRKRTHKGFQKKMLEDWEILRREEKLEKRLKQGKLTKEEYKREMAALNKELGITDDDGIMDYAAIHDGYGTSEEEDVDAPPAAKRPRVAPTSTSDDDDDEDDLSD